MQRQPPRPHLVASLTWLAASCSTTVRRPDDAWPADGVYLLEDGAVDERGLYPVPSDLPACTGTPPSCLVGTSSCQRGAGVQADGERCSDGTTHFAICNYDAGACACVAIGGASCRCVPSADAGLDVCGMPMHCCWTRGS